MNFEVDKVNRDMDNLSQKIASLTAKSDQVGIHHSPFFRDYLTHSAVIEADSPIPSKPEYSSQRDSKIYRYERYPIEKQIDSEPFSSFVKPYTIHYPAAVTNPPQPPIQPSQPRYLHNSQNPNPISTTILSTTTPRPLPLQSPIKIDGRRSLSPGRPQPAPPRLLSPPAVRRCLSSPRPIVFSGTVSSQQALPPRQQALASVCRREEPRNLEASSLNGSGRGKGQEMGIGGQVKEKLAFGEIVVEPEIRKKVGSPEELLKLITYKFELEKQSVAEAFDTMLKKVIDQTDLIRHRIFAEVDEVEGKVKDHIIELSRKLQEFMHHANSLQDQYSLLTKNR